MKNEEIMIADGYKIENARIKSADLSMADHGILTMDIVLEGCGWGCCHGGFVLGKGYLGGDRFDGSAKGLEYIMRIMDTVGVDTFSALPGKYVRVATKGWGSCVKIIGNIIKDQWFDPEEFFSMVDTDEPGEKETPQKPANLDAPNGEVRRADCPRCGYCFPDVGGAMEWFGEVEQYDYCPECGQRIDWKGLKKE